MAQLEGKVAIVTGAAVGIGRAIAVAFGGAGAKVVVNYSKSEAEAMETAEEISKVGGTPLVVRADVSKDDEVRDLVRQTLAEFGRIDVLVNNAGINAPVPFHDLEAVTVEDWDRVFAINVRGTFLCSRAVVAPMRAIKDGSIINIASVGGVRPRASSMAYAASKAAVIHLTQCLANTLGPEIRVNAIAPGLTHTRIQVGRPNFALVLDNYAQAVPLKRPGAVEDVAEAALFLAAGARNITGVILSVDGGRHLG